jgi:hypothetical protein
MRYIVLAAVAAAALWLLQDNNHQGIASASPASTTQVDDLGRIVIVGHRTHT